MKWIYKSLTKENKSEFKLGDNTNQKDFPFNWKVFFVRLEISQVSRSTFLN